MWYFTLEFQSKSPCAKGEMAMEIFLMWFVVKKGFIADITISYTSDFHKVSGIMCIYIYTFKCIVYYDENQKEILDWAKRMGTEELNNCHWNLSASHYFWNEQTKYINYDELFVRIAGRAGCVSLCVLFQFVCFWMDLCMKWNSFRSI